jgi:hypothetical protein
MIYGDQDPLGFEQLAETVRLIAERHRAGERGLDELVREIVLQRFCSSAATPNSLDGDAVLQELIAELMRQARALLDSGELLDKVDEASMESFPASARQPGLARNREFDDGRSDIC